MKLPTDSCQNFMYMLFGHDKSLVSFHNLDLSKIMTSVSKPTEQDGEFYLDLHEYVLWAR